MDALGLVELNSIAAGIEAGDSMLKVAATTLTAANPVCSGKFVVMVRGSVAAVKSSVEAGVATGAENIVDSLLIPNVHKQVFQAINGAAEIPETGAIGVIETFSLASCIHASDAAVKAADVLLIEIRLGRGLGGKSYVVLTGDVSAVSEAVRVGKSVPECEGMIARTSVIPAPHESIREALI
ncbi:MAG: BMC domain-containing protein [Oscillospiraceae bacterium]|nr:BMC domain-containing protein [Oscillospiraceae bacterium]MCL2277799.1 BMC domain-containing protein [Oscillospiraceae bacterium]